MTVRRQMSIPEMQAFAAEMHARCRPREGFMSREAVLFLNAEEIAGLDALARFLGLCSSFQAEIAAIIKGAKR